jgi:hypothetical protein
MIQREDISIVRELMFEFADATGLLSDKVLPRRYLWTDAFAVCNFLGLYKKSRDGQYMELALRLVDEVHYVLGRHRTDDTRTGWISGLDDKEGLMHPAIGGLRIGKKLRERRADEPVDDDEEWDRDGQYYHYLTKWMHALNLVSRATGCATFATWAMELAKTAHAKFTYMPSFGGQKLMYWKMSIDLSYPLVSSMGQHDPLDGLITYLQLKASASISRPYALRGLDSEITDLAAICGGKNWVTTDPLGLGGLLSDACQLAKVTISSGTEHIGLIADILEASVIGLRSYLKGDPFRLPAYHRFAFREFGLSIGLHGLEKLSASLELLPGCGDKKDHMRRLISALMKYNSMSAAIERYWLDPANRRAGNWEAHKDINMVMLAASLAPEGYMGL